MRKPKQASQTEKALASSQGFFIKQTAILDITFICDRLPAERKVSMYLEGGSFVRVRKDLDDLRRGKDAQVYKDMGDQVALLFGRNRYNEDQQVECVGVELWEKSELDLSTVY